MKYSVDKRVLFDPIAHTYTLDSIKKLTSVTTLISKFKNQFDSDYHATRIAKRDGKTKEEILKQWKDKANFSCEVGTYIHWIVENYILTGEIITTGFHVKELMAVKFINDFFISKRLTPVFTEHIVYNEKFAGQIDLICKDANGNFYIIDFKTNEKIETNSYGKRMKGIFNNILDANYFHYSLQALYLQTTRYRVNDWQIVYSSYPGE